MNEFLKIPERRRGLPVWRLCVLMALTFLLFLAGGQRFIAAIGPV